MQNPEIQVRVYPGSLERRGEGFQRAGQAAGVGGIRHGRVAHPPMSWKKIEKKINKKEKMLGFCSAIGATSRKSIVEERGHKISNIESLPIVVSSEIEDISKTSQLKKILISLGLGEDLKRSEKIARVPSGKSRMRGRKRTTALSCIIAVTKGDSRLQNRLIARSGCKGNRRNEHTRSCSRFQTYTSDGLFYTGYREAIKVGNYL